jgi:hypothetical protein
MRRNNSNDNFCLPDQNDYDENNFDECNDVIDQNNRKDLDYLQEMNNYPIDDSVNANNDYMDNIPSNIKSKRNNQRDYSYRGRTNPDNRMRSSKDELLDKIRYMTNRIDKVVEQYRDKDLVPGEQTHFQNNYKTHQNKKNKNKFNISANSKRDDYNYKKRNRTKNKGKYIDDNQFKIDYTKKNKIFDKMKKNSEKEKQIKGKKLNYLCDSYNNNRKKQKFDNELRSHKDLNIDKCLKEINEKRKYNDNQYDVNCDSNDNYPNNDEDISYFNNKYESKKYRKYNYNDEDKDSSEYYPKNKKNKKNKNLYDN